MIPTVTGGAVFVSPSARLRGEQVVQRLKQVCVATGSGLQDRDPRCGMGDENREKPITLVKAECGDL